jgi:hypothetical protein
MARRLSAMVPLTSRNDCRGAHWLSALSVVRRESGQRYPLSDHRFQSRPNGGLVGIIAYLVSYLVY